MRRLDKNIHPHQMLRYITFIIIILYEERLGKKLQNGITIMI